MKLLFTTLDYHTTGGVQTVVKYLAHGLKKRGHDVYIATVITQDEPRHIDDNGVIVDGFVLYYDYRKKVKGEVEEYRNYVKRGNFQVIICECLQCPNADALFEILDDLHCLKLLHSHSFSGLDVKLFTKRDDILHTVGNVYSYIIWHAYYSIYIKGNINKYDGVISLSHMNSDDQYLKKNYKGKTFILTNAANDMFFCDCYDSKITKYIHLKITDYFISVANYNSNKNQELILMEYYKSNASRNFAMVFVGAKKNDYLRKLIKLKVKLDRKFGHRKVFFLTCVEREDIPGLIFSATLYLAGSRREAFSISLIETMAVGTPFISTDTGNVRELPGGVTIKNPTDMHEEIDRMTKNLTMLEKYSIAGKKYAYENCRENIAVDRLENIVMDTYIKKK